MLNLRRMPQKKRKSCLVQTDFRRPREDNFGTSVSQCSMHQESLCKVSDYEISPHSKYNLPEICCCDSRGRAIYWLYKHNLADGECVRQTKHNRPPEREYILPERVSSICTECSLRQEHIKQQHFRKQLLKLRDIFVKEPSSDIKITETHNSYINLGDIEAFHILLSEDNLCNDKYHNLVMNLEIKQKLLEAAHRKFTKHYDVLQKHPSQRQINCSRSQYLHKISAENLQNLVSLESFYESKLLSTGGLEINDLDHILNQLNFFIRSKRVETISDTQREQLAKYLKIIAEDYECTCQQRGKLRKELASKLDQKINERKPSLLELTKMRFIDSTSEIEIDPFHDDAKKMSSSHVITDQKHYNPHINSEEKARIGSLGSIVDNIKKFKSFDKLDTAKKCHSSELKKHSEKELTKKIREKNRKKAKPEKKKSSESEPKKSEADKELERLKKVLQKKERDRGKDEVDDVKELRIKQLLREQELERLKAEEKEKEIQILKELLKEKERKIAEEEVKEKQILKELLREKEKRKAEEEEERLLLKEILDEREKRKAEDEGRERQRLKDLIREKEKIIIEERVKEKEKRRKGKHTDKKKEKLEEQKQKGKLNKEKDLKKSSDKEIREKEKDVKTKKSKSADKVKKDSRESTKDCHKGTVKENPKETLKENHIDTTIDIKDHKYAKDHKDVTKDNNNQVEGNENHKETAKDNYKEQPKNNHKHVFKVNYKELLNEYYQDKYFIEECHEDILREIQKDLLKDNLREMINENNKEIMRENHRELIKEYHRDKINMEERLKCEDQLKRNLEKDLNGSRACKEEHETVSDKISSNVSFFEKENLKQEASKIGSSLERVSIIKSCSDEDTRKKPKFSMCLTEPPICSSSRIIREQLESLEQIPEEETIKDSLEDGKKSRKDILKVDQSVMTFPSLTELGETRNKRRSNISLKECATMASHNVETMEAGISVKPPQLKPVSFPTEQEDLFHLPRTRLQELDMKNIKQDPRFRCPKKKDRVDILEKASQIPSATDGASLQQPPKITTSKCGLYEQMAKEQVTQLFNVTIGDHNDSTAEAELGTELEARSLPTTASCYSNHIVSIKDSLLHLDDGKIFETATPKTSNDNLSKMEKIREKEGIKPDLVSVSNGIPIYKEGFEIARITNQTSSCYSTLRRYARTRVNKSTQMFEHVTSNDLYTLKWIHDNLFEIDINPHTLIVDEKIKELSEMGGVS